MKKHGDLERQIERATLALYSGEWWDGRRWHAPDEAPAARGRTETEDAYRARVAAWVQRRAALMATRYQSARDVLEAAYSAMLGQGGADSLERLRAAQRFERSAEADRTERSASTEAEAHAELIYQAAQPYLRKKPQRNRIGFTDEAAPRTAWGALAAYLTRTLKTEITPNRLRMICRHRGEK